ncbi:glycosyltransferase [Sunxiuqinia indica]|uniref:glycosyltransferase n=1 Tax=Sunxiuqinia indica TaxID=2692584 RepID=UPI00135B8CA7|nr:glycosyltransferase [Sunxiuqinia indica]
MKVLHIGKYFPPYWGGIEKVNFDIVETLNKFGYRNDVLCFNDKRNSITEEKEYCIYRSSTVTSAFSSPLSFSIFQQLRKIYKKYDIIHLHVPNPMGAIALQSVPFKGKIIVHWHSDIIKQKTLKKLYGPFQSALLKRADKIIVTTPNYLEGSEVLAPYRDKCTVIPIGIANSEFPSNKDFREQLEEKYRDKKVIFSIGRLIYYKGFDYLINAAKSLPDNYVVLIGGTGILRKKLEQQITNNRLEHKVKLLGNIPFDQLGEYYRRANIYCLPSTERSEAFGVVLIEAMSFGCPIVATNINGSGVPWVTQDNITGITVEPKNSAALAQALIRMGRDDVLTKKFGENAQQRYQTVFKKSVMAQNIIRLYQELMN